MNILSTLSFLAENQAASSIVVLIFSVLAIGIGLLSIAFWVWMLIDCIKNEPSEGNDKIIWLLVILFLQGLGALIYFFARRPTRIKQLGH